MLPESTHIAAVHLRVADLSNELEFYGQKLGFSEIKREGTTAFLATDSQANPLLTLTEDKQARRSFRAPGLFHVAYLFPSRRKLAEAFKRVYEQQWRFQGFADHGVSEAMYLADPEGNGIELYADRPKSDWRYVDGQLQMTTEHLDLENLMSELKKGQAAEELKAEMKIGHIHLQVSDLSKAEKFYHDLAGFDVTQRNYPGALFVSAGGYHHHIGLNIWNSRGTSLPPDRLLGLQQFDITLGNKETHEALKKSVQNSTQLVDDRGSTFVAKDLDGIHVAFRSD